MTETIENQGASEVIEIAGVPFEWSNTDQEFQEENITAKVLGEVLRVLDDYVVFPDPESRDAVALWVLHSWTYDSFECSPRLNFFGGKGSGKTRAAEVVQYMTHAPFMAASVTPAVLFRKIETSSGSVIFLDETDKLFGQGGSASKNQMLQSVINSGYRRTGMAARTQGAEGVREFRTFAPMVLSGIGQLPEDMQTRCVRIAMKPTSGNVKVKSLRMRFAQPIFDRLKVLLRKWSVKYADPLAMAIPDLPAGVNDRPAEIWEPLLAIGELAGSVWSERARKACVHLVGVSAKKDDPLPVKLLRAMRELYDDNPDRKGFFSAEIPERLGGPWKSLTPKALARTLSEYDVFPDKFRDDDRQARGYLREDLEDVWNMLGITPEEKPDPTEYEIVEVVPQEDEDV
jgi:hypothetical protein